MLHPRKKRCHITPVPPHNSHHSITATFLLSLKGLGHAILGNFSIDQMVIELTETTNYRRTQTNHRKAKKGQGWTKLGRIEMNCIWVNLKNVGPPFFKFVSVYIK